MKVILSRNLGYCMGVRRAVDFTFDALSRAEKENSAGADAENRKVYTFGELIHNNTVLAELRERGVKIITDIDIAPDHAPAPDLRHAFVVLCAHGVPPETELTLRRRGAQIIDASCPMVKKSQMAARELDEKNYSVFLAGEKAHSEITGIKGYNKNAIVVSSGSEAREEAAGLYAKNPNAKTALLAQTTISQTEYDTISGEIKKIFPALEMRNTICGATSDRQAALRQLCKEVDALIIAGGTGSSNTRRLLSIAQETGKPAWLVEDAQSLPREIFSFATVGLAAGASTPDSVIKDIMKHLTQN